MSMKSIKVYLKGEERIVDIDKENYSLIIDSELSYPMVAKNYEDTEKLHRIDNVFNILIFSVNRCDKNGRELFTDDVIYVEGVEYVIKSKGGSTLDNYFNNSPTIMIEGLYNDNAINLDKIKNDSITLIGSVFDRGIYDKLRL